MLADAGESMYQPQNPLIIQSDRTILAEVHSPGYTQARDALMQFAELIKSPEHIHTYRITALSLWNAASSGLKAADVLGALETWSKYEVPANVRFEINQQMGRFGLVKLERRDDDLALTSHDAAVIAEIAAAKSMQSFIVRPIDSRSLLIHAHLRGHVKQALIRLNFPVEDLAGYTTGDRLEVELRQLARSGRPFTLRDYQIQSIESFWAGGAASGGSGVVVLPCGAGKTIVGIGVMKKVQEQTLILATNTVAVRQWIDEIRDKTKIPSDQIGEYTGDSKTVAPITVATYQILTYRREKDGEFPHFGLFNKRNWGLIIYDEVHLLPAPVFRITAEIQARRRLGLTATLVREDGRETDVFSLIGPKKFDVPWKELEQQNWIAAASCEEIRVRLPEEIRMAYAVAPVRDKFRIASENPAKMPVIDALLERHRQDRVLVIGQYIDQLKELQRRYGAPLITGATPNREREDLYGKFRRGEISMMIVSKVANFSIDLPDANVAIQVSGTFGSRQEEAQRLGRILRPKETGAHFYSIVTRDSRDQEFAANRQMFLTEQGYQYTIADAEGLFNCDAAMVD
jgi:DNA excision repair protein ERCC-3